jgi:hypothetical protein
MAVQRLIDAVVNHLPDELVETVTARTPSVHAGPFADRIEALEYLYILNGIRIFH